MIDLIHGEDEFLRSRRLAEIKRRAGPAELVSLNTTELDGAHLAASALHAAADAAPFLAERRLVIVHGLPKASGRTKAEETAPSAQLAPLLDYLGHEPSTTDLILVEDQTLPSDHPLLRRLQALAKDGSARISLCRPPAPRELAEWIRDHAQGKGVSIAPAATQALADAIGPDLRLIDVELDKLIAYVGAGNDITRRDVETLVPYVQAASIFKLLDAIAEQREAEAFCLLRRLREAGAAGPYLLTMIGRQIRILLQVAELQAEGKSTVQIAERLRLREFMVQNAARQALTLSAAQLVAALDLTLATDVAIKSGQQDEDTALVLLVNDLLQTLSDRR
jgi:DNA polymerase-3 subunit delta